MVKQVLRTFLRDFVFFGLGVVMAMPWNPGPRPGPGLCLTDLECCDLFRDC